MQKQPENAVEWREETEERIEKTTVGVGNGQEGRQRNSKKPTQRLKEMMENEDPQLSRNARIRGTIAIIALTGMLLPWLRLDGYSEAMSAAELIAYAFTSPERGSLFGVSMMGALAILLTPVVVMTAGVLGFFQAITGGRSLGANLVGALAPLAMLMLAHSIVSSDGWEVVGIPLPGFGLMLTVAAQGTLFIHAMREGDD